MGVQNIICPCSSEQLYIDCCKKIHNNPNSANSPEKLMRARYSAFVLYNVDFLKYTQYPPTRKLHNYKEIEHWTKSVEWKKLNVLHSIQNNNIGFVEFQAFYIEKIKLECIHGKSNFILENNQWYYTDES
jgi:SEC-C motif-containing protein